MENEKKETIDLNRIEIEEFPPSFKRNSDQNQINDDFEEFLKNFNSVKVNQEKETNTYQEIATQNMKSKTIKYNDIDFYLCFIAYSNINFIILSNQKKIGNIYEAEVEEPEFQIDQDEDEEELPPNYEIKCLLGNRFDNLNSFFSNFIASFYFNLIEKANKSMEKNPFHFKETEESNKNKKIREEFSKDFYFTKNPNSFFNEYVKCGSNLLISLDLKFENVLKKENLKDNLNQLDEIEVCELVEGFTNILRKELVDLLN